jgi:hypothetical protein
MNEPVLNPIKGRIRKEELRKNIVHAAQGRALVTMFSVLPSLLIMGIIFNEQQIKSYGGFVGLFGGPFIVGWVMTKFYCRPKVCCPYCKSSLWNCGNGAFKVRHIRLKDNAKECPNCHVPIVSTTVESI